MDPKAPVLRENQGTHSISKPSSMMDGGHCLIKMSARPSRGLMDEKMTILVQNAPPGLQLTVHGLHQCEDGHSWEAFGYYAADALGNVDVSQDLSLGGTYFGVEPMGLLWSLRPVPGSRPGLRLRKMNVQTPLVITVSVYQGHQAEGFANLVPLAAVEVERWYMAPGIRRIDVTEDGLTAAIFLPPGPGPFSGVLDLWGAGGKLIEIRAALLASNGFASMALDYLTPRITKETGKMVDYDYFEKAYRALEKHPQVLSSRIAIIGASFGSSIALKMAAYSQVIKPWCLVLIGGSHLAKRDGHLKDTWNIHFKHRERPYFNEKNEMILKHQLVPKLTDPQLKVEMGRIQCPVLSVIGEDDPSWPSIESAVDMKEMMERSGNSHLLTILKYPKTGHLIEPPYSPHNRASIYKGEETVMNLWGGETVAHSLAQEDCWRKILLFLHRHLNTGMKPGTSLLSRL